VYVQAIDILKLMITTMQRVPVRMKQLLPLYELPALDDLRPSHQPLIVDAEHDIVYNILCALETLADRVDQQWRRQNVDWKSLPDCGTHGGPAAATSTSAAHSDDLDPFVIVSHGLIGTLELLKVARCIADARQNGVDTTAKYL